MTRIHTKSTRAILQAGGLGTRIRSVSETVPKALLPVGGTPMIERLLRHLIALGLTEITIIIGHNGEQIEEHILSLRGDLPKNVDISFYREEKALGNVGAIGKMDSDFDRILFAFGDLVTDLDFSKLLDLHRERDCDVTLASHYEDHRLQLGEIGVNGDDVVSYEEKPLKQFLICSGIGVFERHAVHLVGTVGFPCGLSDLIRCALIQGLRVTHWTHGAFWMDVNTEEALRVADAAVRERMTAA